MEEWRTKKADDGGEEVGDKERRSVKSEDGRKMIKKAMTRIEGWGGVGGRVGGGEEGGRAPTRRGGRRHSAAWCSPCGTSWSHAVWAEHRRPPRSGSLLTRCPWPPAQCECWAAPCRSGHTQQEQQRDMGGGEGIDEYIHGLIKKTNKQGNKQTSKQIVHWPRRPCSPLLWQSFSSWGSYDGAAQTNSRWQRALKNTNKKNFVDMTRLQPLYEERSWRSHLLSKLYGGGEEHGVPARGRWQPSARCTWSPSGRCADLAAPAGGAAEFRRRGDEFKYGHRQVQFHPQIYNKQRLLHTKLFFLVNKSNHVQPSDLNINSNLIINNKPIKLITTSFYEHATIGTQDLEKQDQNLSEYIVWQITEHSCCISSSCPA